MADPIFWKVLVNNFWFAVGTIPASIALAIAMALLVNKALPGRPFFATGLLHAYHLANDCGGQHLAFLLLARYWTD